MAALTNQQITALHHDLNFTYKDFVRLQQNLQNVKFNNYCFLQQIGQGAFAQVYKAINQTTQKIVAIKILNLRVIQTQPNLKVKTIRKRLAKQESKIMMKFNSPNLLKCYECFQNRDLKFMVIQFCQEGSLQDKIDSMEKIPEQEAVSILKQIINGVGQCHKQRIVHRDLKADNVLIHNGEYKIADFGFSKQLKITNEEDLTKNTCLGTMTTMAPQVLRREDYGLKSDIWSVGVIFFQMLFGQCPFKSNTSAQMVTQIVNAKLLNEQTYKGVKPSYQAKKFFKEVLVVDIKKRLGWRELLQHELFKIKSKSLPDTFHRRFQMKQRDQQLERLQRQFMNPQPSNLNISYQSNSNHIADYSTPKIDRFFDQNTNKEINNDARQIVNNQPTREVLHTAKRQNNGQLSSPSPIKIIKVQQKPLSQSQKIDKCFKIAVKQSAKKHKETQKQISLAQSLKKIQQQNNEQKQNARLSYKKLDKQQMQRIKRKVNKQQEEIYKWANRIHVQCLKTQCIYTNIIQPIEKYKLLELTDRRNIEFMYLISTRCLNNISPINDLYNKRKENPIIRDIHYEVSKLYNDVMNTWMKYSQILTSKENEKFVMLVDWFSKKINKKQMKIKDRYLSGIESMVDFRPQGAQEKKVKPSMIKQQDLLDYDKQEQIQYTNEYIQQILPGLKVCNESKMSRNYMIHYRDICRIQAQDLRNRKFSQYLALVLL